MAQKGRKPTPTNLKLIKGNPGKRPITENPDITVRVGKLKPPRELTEAQQPLWSRFIESAWWLREHDIPKAYMWTCLQSQHDNSPEEMNSARIAQLRALGSELGLDPSARARLGIHDKQEEDPTEQFFH